MKRKYYVARNLLASGFLVLLFSMRMNTENSLLKDKELAPHKLEKKVWALRITGDFQVIPSPGSSTKHCYTIERAANRQKNIMYIGILLLVSSAIAGGINLKMKKNKA